MISAMRAAEGVSQTPREMTPKIEKHKAHGKKRSKELPKASKQITIEDKLLSRFRQYGNIDRSKELFKSIKQENRELRKRLNEEVLFYLVRV